MIVALSSAMLITWIAKYILAPLGRGGVKRKFITLASFAILLAFTLFLHLRSYPIQAQAALLVYASWGMSISIIDYFVLRFDIRTQIAGLIICFTCGYLLNGLQVALLGGLLGLLAGSAIYFGGRIFQERKKLGAIPFGIGDVTIIALICMVTGPQDLLWVLLIGLVFSIMIGFFHNRIKKGLATGPVPLIPGFVLASFVALIIR